MRAQRRSTKRLFTTRSLARELPRASSTRVARVHASGATPNDRSAVIVCTSRVARAVSAAHARARTRLEIPTVASASASASERARRDAARVILASSTAHSIHDESMRALAPLCASSRASSRDARVADRVFRSRRTARANALGEHNSRSIGTRPASTKSPTTTGPTTTTGSGTTTNGSVNATDPLVAQARETLAMSEVGDLLTVTAESAMGTSDGDGADGLGTRATTVRTPRSCDGSSSDESA